MRVVLSGGGTGGHIFPAIAVANALKKIRPEIEILFVGARGKMEMEKVPAAGYRIEGLWISGIHRTRIWRNLTFPLKLISALWKSNNILRAFKPDVVVGFGGFASGPLLLMGTKKRIPALIQEQNAYPGLTNLKLAARVSKICVSFPKMGRFFPEDKIVVTGNPVRAILEQNAKNRDEGLAHFGLTQDKTVLLVFGGSLGARTLNEMMLAGYEVLKSRPDVHVIWQCGTLYFEAYMKSATAALENISLLPFVDRMDLAYAASELIVCRAGAITISEVCAVGKPALLIPSPNVAENHQEKNALAMEAEGAALWMKDEVEVEGKWKRIFDLLAQNDIRESLGAKAKKLAFPDAANDIAMQIINLAESNDRTA